MALKLKVVYLLISTFIMFYLFERLQNYGRNTSILCVIMFESHEIIYTFTLIRTLRVTSVSMRTSHEIWRWPLFDFDRQIGN